jgi:hypothetical protein
MQYLVVYGANYCPYTHAIWPTLSQYAFVYLPYTQTKNKERYWSKIKNMLRKDNMTFPTLALVTDHSATELKIHGDKLVYADSLVPCTAELSLPPKNIKRESDLQSAFRDSSEAFASDGPKSKVQK